MLPVEHLELSLVLFFQAIPQEILVQCGRSPSKGLSTLSVCYISCYTTSGMGKTKGGYLISKGGAIGILVAFVVSLVAVGLLVHFLADRPEASAGTSVGSSSAESAIGKHVKVVSNIRLPRTVLPQHYDVRLLPIIEKGNFSILGRVSIDIECKEETDRIILHSADIIVDRNSIRLIQHGKENDTVAVDAIEYDTDREFLIIPLGGKAKLVKGLNYTLSMDFVGNLNDQLKGLYRSSYKENGAEKFLAASQLEATDARRAFPCFDEPNMKSTFSVTLGRHKDMQALSNMPLVNSTPIEGMDGFVWDHFEKTVPMSTYLAAFVVADFVRVEADTGNAKWKFNIYARPSARNQTEYAKVLGPKILAFYEDYFQIPYPLPKQDMIAIPDFGPGAMENWGLITYRETLLLYDEKLSSAANKERVALVIAHELAHQWFGNLVTMDWWTDLWLNEGFANYLEIIGAEFVEPGFKLAEEFVLSDVHHSMNLDALESSHAISFPVNHPDEISSGISYSKGSSVIRMLISFIGEKTFRRALTNYLNERRYSNAVQDDLWEALTQQAKLDRVDLPASVKQIMDSWTLKMGYPVVNVQRSYKNQTVTVTQERFLLQRSNTSDNATYLWWVPLTYTKDFKTKGSTWLPENQTTMSLSLDFNVTSDQWLIFNIDEMGFYRVNYDQRNWQLITQQLMTDHTAINVINRAQIMNDALNLAQANLLDYDIVLNLTKYLEKEKEYLPWQTTLTSLGYISDMMSRTADYGLFKKHIRKIVTPLYNSLGFSPRSNDSHQDTKLRISAVNWACSMGNKDCLENAKRSYSQWMADPDNTEIISPDLKRSVICNAIREGGEEEWDFAFDRYVKSNVAGEKDILLASLTCSSQAWILSKILEMSVNASSGIRKQDASAAIRLVASNPLGRYLAFNFIRNRWNDLKVTFAAFKGLGNIIKATSQSFNTELELKELLEFLDSRQTEFPEPRSSQQAVDVAKNNLRWKEKSHPQVVDWLQRNYATL